MESTLRYYNYFCDWCNDGLKHRNPYRSSREEINNRIHQTQTPLSGEETNNRIHQTSHVLQIFHDIFSPSKLLRILKVIAFTIVTLIVVVIATHTVGIHYLLRKIFLIYYTRLCFSLHMQFWNSFGFARFIVKAVSSFLHSKIFLFKIYIKDKLSYLVYSDIYFRMHCIKDIVENLLVFFWVYISVFCLP